jgi:ankyrin repeat protein
LVTTGNAKTLPELQQLVAAYPELLNQRSAGKKGQPALLQALTQGRKEIVAWLLSQPGLLISLNLGALLQDVLDQIGIVETRHASGIRLLLEAAVKRHDQRTSGEHSRQRPDAPPLSKRALQESRATLLTEGHKTSLGSVIALRPLLEECKLIAPNRPSKSVEKPKVEQISVNSRTMNAGKRLPMDSGFATLTIAATAGDTETVKAVLKSANNADALAKTRDSRGWTALMHAARGGHTATVMAILNAVEDRDTLACMQSNATEDLDTLAFMQGNAVADFETLMHSGAGTSALMQAVMSRNPETVKAILNAVTDKDKLACLQNKDGQTALTSAIYKHNVQTIVAILSAVKEPDTLIGMKDRFGFTALSIATAHDDIDIFRAISERITDWDNQAKIRSFNTATTLALADIRGGREKFETILNAVTDKAALLRSPSAPDINPVISTAYDSIAELIREAPDKF